MGCFVVIKEVASTKSVSSLPRLHEYTLQKEKQPKLCICIALQDSAMNFSLETALTEGRTTRRARGTKLQIVVMHCSSLALDALEFFSN